MKNGWTTHLTNNENWLTLSPCHMTMTCKINKLEKPGGQLIIFQTLFSRSATFYGHFRADIGTSECSTRISSSLKSHWSRIVPLVYHMIIDLVQFEISVSFWLWFRSQFITRFLSLCWITDGHPIRSSRQEVFCKKGILKNFAKFAGKHLFQSFFFNKVAGLALAIFLKQRHWHRCFPVNFAKLPLAVIKMARFQN